VIVTEWREFRSPDFQRLRALLKQPAIFDGRNLYNPGYVHRLGFHYYPVGRHPAARSAMSGRNCAQGHGAVA
jgi:UDPglucose 6-dehydrogenase